jgi:hypothetical protein
MGDTRLSRLIVTTPRSGIWMLVEALTATGLTARPEEDFGTDCKGNRRLGEPLTGEALLRVILSEENTSSGMFSAKVDWLQSPRLIHMSPSSARDGNLPQPGFSPARFAACRQSGSGALTGMSTPSRGAGSRDRHQAAEEGRARRLSCAARPSRC